MVRSRLAAGDSEAAQAAYDAGEWEFDVQFRLQNRLEMAPRLDAELAAFSLLAQAEAAAKAGNADRAQELLDQAEGGYSGTQAIQTAQLRRRDVRRAIDRLLDEGRQPDDEEEGGNEPGQELPGGG